MTGLNVNRHINGQGGFTLIETMISLALTSLLLLGGIKLVTTALFQHRTVNGHYHFWQHMTIASDILRQELRKAGFNGQKGHSVRLAGAEAILSVSPDHQGLAFVYLKQKGGSEYQTIAYRKQEGQLIQCGKTTSQPVSWTEAFDSSQAAPCDPVFDNRSIVIDRFDASVVVLTRRSGVPVSEMLNLTLSASSVANPELVWHQTIQFPVRNWR